MKTRLASLLSSALFLLTCTYISPASARDSSDLLDKSLAAIRKAENPIGTSPTTAQRIDFLTQAITMAQQAPNHRLKGHRILAIQAIRSAITEIRGGDLTHQAAVYLHTADAELTTAVSLAKGGPNPFPSPSDAPAPALDAKSDANAKNGAGQTPLHLAALNGSKETTERLIAQGADVNTRDNNGHTPFYDAMNRIPWNQDVPALLLAHGADPNLADNQGRTPLHLAAGWIRTDKTEFLLGYKVDVNARDKNGDTPLYAAVNFGARDDIAQALLAHGADPTLKGHDGRTPGEIALQKGDKDMATILDNSTATLGPPPAPIDGVTPPNLIAQFIKDLAGTPPGPVENEVTQEVVQTMQGLAQLTQTKTSPRDAIVANFGLFTLTSPVAQFYAQGLAAIYSGNATLTESAAKTFQDNNDQNSATTTIIGKTTTDKGPFLMFGPGATDFADAKVPEDRRVIASFCLIQQHGRWKVHCLYFSTAPLAGTTKDFVIHQLAALSRTQGH